MKKDKTDFIACMNCGSANIRWASRSEQASEKSVRVLGVEEGGASIAYKCLDCGFTGTPVIFDSEEKRKKFADLKSKNGR